MTSGVPRPVADQERAAGLDQEFLRKLAVGRWGNVTGAGELLRLGWTPEPVQLEQLAPVLGELLAGSTDRTACRNLRVSPRTYSRRLADLQDLVGVETRFQGGFLLGFAATRWRPVVHGSAGPGARSEHAAGPNPWMIDRRAS